jgi:hypothetical protein
VPTHIQLPPESCTLQDKKRATTLHHVCQKQGGGSASPPRSRTVTARRYQGSQPEDRFWCTEFWRPMENGTRPSRADMAMLDEERRVKERVILGGNVRLASLAPGTILSASPSVFFLFGQSAFEFPRRMARGRSPPAPLQRSRSLHVASGGRSGSCDANDCKPRGVGGNAENQPRGLGRHRRSHCETHFLHSLSLPGGSAPQIVLALANLPLVALSSLSGSWQATPLSKLRGAQRDSTKMRQTSVLAC